MKISAHLRANSNINPIIPIPARIAPKASRNRTLGTKSKNCETQITDPTIIIIPCHSTTFFNSCIAQVKTLFEFINLAFTKMGERLIDFSSCIAQRAIFRGNSQPSICGEERTIQGGNKHGQMADKTTPESDTKRLDDTEREPHKSNNAGA